MIFNPEFSPFPALTTRRFVLRELNKADAHLIHELRSDQETNALIGRENSKSVEDALLFIERIQNGVRRNESIYWVVCSENSPDLIGTIGLWNFDKSARSAEIGYELLPGFRGQGIMPEVLLRVVQFGFEQVKLKQIHAFCLEKNTRSVKLLEKCGFTVMSLEDDIPPEIPGMLHFVATPA